MVKKYGLPTPEGLKSPLEVVDLGADMVNRAATLPGEVVGKMVDAAGKTITNLKDDIAAPREQPERPIPPEQLIKSIPNAVGHVVTGVVDIAKSGVDAAVQNVEGARRELEDFIGG